MSALNILGGIGAGVQQGVGFMQQKKMQDEQLRMQNELHTARMDEFDTKKAEQQRIEDLSKMRAELYQQHPDADRYQVESMFAEQAVKAGKLRGEELDNAFNAVEKLKQQFGSKAYDAMRAGDIKPLQQVLGERGIAVDFTPDRKGLQMWRAGGERDAQGNLAAQTLPLEGLLQMDAFATTRQRMAEQAKLNQDSRKTESEIAKNDAQSGNYRAQAAGRTPYLEGPDGRVYPNPAFGGVSRGRSGGSGAGAADKEFDAIGTLEAYAKAFKDEGMGEEGAGWDKARGLEYFGRIRTNNPQLMNSEAGQLIALTASRELAKGNGRLAPTIGRDGGLAINAQVGANLYTVESGVSEARLMQMTGLDGKPLAAGPEDVGKMYLEAIQNAARQEPEAFNAAVVASRTPEVMQKAREAAARGDAGAIRTLQLVPAVARANHYTQTMPVDGANKGGPEAARVEFSNAFNADAKPTQQEQVAARNTADAEHKRDVVIPERTRQIETARFNQALNTLRTGSLEPLKFSSMIAQLADAGQAVPELMKRLTEAEAAEVQKLIEAQSKGKR